MGSEASEFLAKAQQVFVLCSISGLFQLTGFLLSTYLLGPKDAMCTKAVVTVLPIVTTKAVKSLHGLVKSTMVALHAQTLSRQCFGSVRVAPGSTAAYS